MSNIGLEDVAVAGLEVFQDGGLVDDAGTAVIGESAEKNGIFAVLGIQGAELAEVFTEQGVGLGFGQLNASAIWFARLDLMAVADVGPVLRLVERLEVLDDYYCPLKERQFHDTSFCGEGRRGDREVHYHHQK